jgi:hypothetical protein
VGWLARIRGEAEGETRAVEDAGDAGASSVVERASPGLSALFGLMKADGRHSVLDLGEGNNRQMEALAPYARLIRFIGLVPGTGDAAAVADPSVLPEHPEYPYDVVLAWGVLDRLGPETRLALIRRLTAITAPDARMYASVSGPGVTIVQPVRATLVGVGRVEEEPVGEPRPTGPQLLPAQVEKLLSPWTVSQAFSLRSGVREYVAKKGG